MQLVHVPKHQSLSNSSNYKPGLEIKQNLSVHSVSNYCEPIVSPPGSVL